MRKVLLIGAALPAAALVNIIVAHEPYGSPLTADLAGLLKPASLDPFRGGNRGKGDKKRAARERRMRGGY